MKKRAKYPLEPRHLNEAAWFYETRGGIEVVAELKNGMGNHIGTTCVMVPWRRVLPAVANHQKIVAARKP